MCSAQRRQTAIPYIVVKGEFLIKNLSEAEANLVPEESFLLLEVTRLQAQHCLKYTPVLCM